MVEGVTGIDLEYFSVALYPIHPRVVVALPEGMFAISLVYSIAGKMVFLKSRKGVWI